MIWRFCTALLLISTMATADEGLRADLEKTYRIWRGSLQTRNELAWKGVTARHRQIQVKNRILSEKRKFPAAVFELPAMPPPVKGLKFLGTRRNGSTCKAYYFGKIDFGVGPATTENLLILSFIGANKAWLYDQTEFINLAALEDVRAELAAGDTRYIDATPELLPSGRIPPTPVEVTEAPYIAKVYVFCPGREVRVQINQISQHLFVNGQDAELVIGGARDGINQVQFTIKHLEEVDSKLPMTVRVYLLSEVNGVKPIMAYEYKVDEGKTAQGFGKGEFVIDANLRAKLLGR